MSVNTPIDAAANAAANAEKVTELYQRAIAKQQSAAKQKIDFVADDIFAQSKKANIPGRPDANSREIGPELQQGFFLLIVKALKSIGGNVNTTLEAAETIVRKHQTAISSVQLFTTQDGKKNDIISTIHQSYSDGKLRQIVESTERDPATRRFNCYTSLGANPCIVPYFNVLKGTDMESMTVANKPIKRMIVAGFVPTSDIGPIASVYRLAIPVQIVGNNGPYGNGKQSTTNVCRVKTSNKICFLQCPYFLTRIESADVVYATEEYGKEELKFVPISSYGAGAKVNPSIAVLREINCRYVSEVQITKPNQPLYCPVFQQGLPLSLFFPSPDGERMRLDTQRVKNMILDRLAKDFPSVKRGKMESDVTFNNTLELLASLMESDIFDLMGVAEYSDKKKSNDILQQGLFLDISFISLLANDVEFPDCETAIGFILGFCKYDIATLTTLFSMAKEGVRKSSVLAIFNLFKKKQQKIEEKAREEAILEASRKLKKDKVAPLTPKIIVDDSEGVKKILATFEEISETTNQNNFYSIEKIATEKLPTLRYKPSGDGKNCSLYLNSCLFVRMPPNDIGQIKTDAMIFSNTVKQFARFEGIRSEDFTSFVKILQVDSEMSDKDIATMIGKINSRETTDFVAPNSPTMVACVYIVKGSEQTSANKRLRYYSASAGNVTDKGYTNAHKMQSIGSSDETVALFRNNLFAKRCLIDVVTK